MLRALWITLLTVPGMLTASTPEAVRTLFASRCASCHSATSIPLEADLNLLDLERLKQSGLIDLNQPEKSTLIERLLPGGGMPKDAPPLSQADINTILDWIRKGAPLPAVIGASPLLEDGKSMDRFILEQILQDLKGLTDAEAQDSRYLVLTHFVLSQEDKGRLEIYRQAIAKLINSLSWQKTISVPQPVDADRTIWRIRLSELGWDRETWRQIMAKNPYLTKLATPALTEVSARLRDYVLPFARADWFVNEASRPPLYNLLLGLPELNNRRATSELEKKIGVNTLEKARLAETMRIGVQKSGVAFFHRMLERYESPYGAYWRSYDFDGTEGDKDLFRHPLPAIDLGSSPFVHAGGEIIFHLPNGLQAYWLENADGRRLDTAPNNIVKDRYRNDGIITNGVSCMNCHSMGLQWHDDDMRRIVNAAPELYGKEVGRILSTYPEKEKMRAIFDQDNKRFAAALKQMGQAPKPEAQGEPIFTLATRFEATVSLRDAAAEIGINAELLKEKVKANARLKSIVFQLEHGGIARASFVAAFKELVKAVVGLDGIIEPLPFDDFTFIPIRPGKFVMGDPVDPDKNRFPHEVELTRPFEIQQFEVTQRLWLTLRKNNPSLTANPLHPVTGVNREDALGFIASLNEQEKRGEYCYRLPSEAEWEYVARSGTTSGYFFADDAERLSAFAWYADNSGKQSHPVGEKLPNPWGVYDIYGNANEWVADGYHWDLREISPKDPLFMPDSDWVKKYGRSSLRDGVLRGGGFRAGSNFTNSTYRFWYHAPEKDGENDSYEGSDGRWKDAGFRLVRVRCRKAATAQMDYRNR